MTLKEVKRLSFQLVSDARQHFPFQSLIIIVTTFTANTPLKPQQPQFLPAVRFYSQ
jgi:hypothetical protein